ncbi:hypothetical protein LNTAR_13057 [Lentisphaera araneosa HTCC2155]|uniref:Uncharacterized protein n=1 Tax=Lentisphaera araneosa HTCC2155 TaxID=313628 RepID=A6DRL0_9BACT|nr:hypothetical protein [Lentisphaera araneosa]EDM25679.1 hypothetical protein LNTAR_13057 [Lentisphaera araneosa HTCC2155]
MIATLIILFGAFLIIGTWAAFAGFPIVIFGIIIAHYNHHRANKKDDKEKAESAKQIYKFGYLVIVLGILYIGLITALYHTSIEQNSEKIETKQT